MAKQNKFVNRILRRLGLMRASSFRSAFAAAQFSRLNSDWTTSLLSSDEEIRGSLSKMRARSRQLVNNNDHAKRFINLLKQNVIGSEGILLKPSIEKETDEFADETNRAIKKAWLRWCKKENASVDGKQSLIDILQLAIATIGTDGEVFLRKVKGFPHNPFRFALEFIDADQVDVNLNSRRQQMGTAGMKNEIRLGVEVDEWRRPVAYHVLDRHPSEAGSRHQVVSADQINHTYAFHRPNITRGVPFMHTAMTKMNMEGKYEEAELTAARIASCIMGFVSQESGDDDALGGEKNKDTGAIEIVTDPGTFHNLAPNSKVETFAPQHPNAGFGEFVKAMLRGIAVGLNTSYHSLTGDLSNVNYSSIRQGSLDERDGYRMLQKFVIEHIIQDVFRDWLQMALLTKQLEIPAPPDGDLEYYTDAMRWQARGWTWVDPLKEIKASKEAVAAGMSTLADEAAAGGKDWKELLEQRKVEIDFAAELGVPIDLGAVITPPSAVDPSGTDGNNANQEPANANA